VRDEMEKEGLEPAGKGRGRPRRWSDEAEKHQQYRARRREAATRLAEVLQAVRNAHWDDANLERAINYGDDPEVLRALIAYCKQHHWMRWQAGASDSCRRGSDGMEATKQPKREKQLSPGGNGGCRSTL
jgi:hypothetical protein